MAKKKGLFKDIPLPVKVSLVACSVAMAFGTIMMFSLPSNNAMLNTDNGEVKITATPSTSQIETAAESGQQSEIINKIYEEEKKDKLNEAVNGKASYLESLKLKNEEKMTDKMDQREKEIEQKANIDAVLGLDTRVQEAKKKEEVRQDRRNLNNQNQQVQQVQQPLVPTIPLFDRDAFLAQETGKLTEIKQLRMATSQNIVTNGIAGNSSSTVIANYAQTGSSSGSSRGNQNNGEAAPIADFLTDGTRLKDVNERAKQYQVAQLDELRKASNSAAGRPTQQGKVTSSAGVTTNSTIQDLANPMGFADTSSMAYVTPGTIYYAILEIGVNTDELSYVRSIIIQEGPLKGGVLLGMPERRGEKAVIMFNKLALNGKDYSINAVALDLETMRSGIADNVDRHTFERYMKLMGAAFISGYADSLAGSTTKTYSDGTTETITERLPDADDQIAYAIGRAGEKLVPIFEREFDREPTVEVDSNREIAIMLLNGIQVEEQ
ncbi:DotG/IcmE/VirB10 family protein [Vibrio parahaemolyticus]